MNADERGLRKRNPRSSAKICVSKWLVFRFAESKDKSALIRSIRVVRVVRVLLFYGTKGRFCLFHPWPYAIIAGRKVTITPWNR